MGYPTRKYNQEPGILNTGQCKTDIIHIKISNPEGIK